MKIKATCKICGKTYIKCNGKSLYCSDECRAEAARRRMAKWREEHPDYHKQYHADHPEAAERFREKHPHYDRDRWRKIRGTVIYKKTCIICGKEFETPFQQATTCSKGCSKLYKTYKHDNRLDRLRSNGEVDADITIDKLIERDDGVCHICGKKIDKEDYRYQDGHRITGHNYPTIDHVIPVSKGGTHTWDNVKLAHMVCNAQKGAKQNA